MSELLVRGLVALGGVMRAERANVRALLDEIAELPSGVPLFELGPWCDSHIDVLVHHRIASHALDASVAHVFDSYPMAPAVVEIHALCKYLPEASHEKGSVGRSVIVSVLQQFADTLLYAGNLADPGILSWGASEWHVTGLSAPERDEPLMHDLGAAREYIHRTGWPTLKRLPFLKVLGWILENAWPSRAGDSPVSRAFNAYTHLFSFGGEENPFELLTALTGLEALFNTGSSTGGQQFRERIQLLLGERESFKGDLSAMYSERSKLVHGAARFLPKRPSWEPPPDAEHRLGAQLSSRDIATALLLAALQFLADANWSELTFEERISGSDTGAPEPQSNYLGHEYLRIPRGAWNSYAAAEMCTSLVEPSDD